MKLNRNIAPGAGYPWPQSWQLVLIGLLLTVCMNTPAATGDTLVIKGSLVNVRAGPGLDSKVLLRLSRGTKVIEISRYKEWVEVATGKRRFDTGWIHDSLLGTSGKPGDDENIALDEFRKDFAGLTEKLHDERGISPFSALEEPEPGHLAITATDDWFAMMQSDREKLLDRIFKMWRQRVPVGLEILVEVVNSRGEQHMMMFK